IPLNRVPPPVAIEKVVADDVEVPGGPTARLAPGTRNVEFHYAGLSLLAPERVKFRYRLEGFDREWTEAGRRNVAYYTNLGPGRYRFRVTACNADGIWNDEGATVDFYVEPHYYQTSWFLAGCALALVVSTAGGFRLR